MVHRTSPPAIDADTVPRRPDHLQSTLVGVDLLVHDRRAGMNHVLNPTAALIWMSIDGNRTASGIIDHLADETGADPAVIGGDVHASLTDLADKGLMTTPGGPDDAPAPRPAETPGPNAGQIRWSPTTAMILAGGAWLPGIGARRAAGTTVVVRSNDTRFDRHLSRLLGCLPPAETAAHQIHVVGDRGASRYRVYVDAVRVSAAGSAEQAVSAVLQRVNRLATDGTPDKVLLHAGAVERNGDVVVVAGASGRGKSTLTAALVAHGFGYLTDEVVVIDVDTGWVEPYPKALDLGDGAIELLGIEPPDDDDLMTTKHAITPGRLGRVSAGGHLRLITFLSDPAVTGGTDLDPGDGATDLDDLVALMANTFPATVDADGALDTLAGLARATPAFRLPRLPLDDAVTLVEEALDVAMCAGAVAP